MLNVPRGVGGWLFSVAPNSSTLKWVESGERRHGEQTELELLAEVRVPFAQGTSICELSENRFMLAGVSGADETGHLLLIEADRKRKRVRVLGHGQYRSLVPENVLFRRDEKRIYVRDAGRGKLLFASFEQLADTPPAEGSFVLALDRSKCGGLGSKHVLRFESNGAQLLGGVTMQLGTGEKYSFSENESGDWIAERVRKKQRTYQSSPRPRPDRERIERERKELAAARDAANRSAGSRYGFLMEQLARGEVRDSSGLIHFHNLFLCFYGDHFGDSIENPEKVLSVVIETEIVNGVAMTPRVKGEPTTAILEPRFVAKYKEFARRGRAISVMDMLRNGLKVPGHFANEVEHLIRDQKFFEAYFGNPKNEPRIRRALDNLYRFVHEQALESDRTTPGKVPGLELSLFGPTGRVRMLAFRGDGAAIAAAYHSRDASITVWDASTGAALGSVSAQNQWRLAFSQRGGRLAAPGKPVEVWDPSVELVAKLQRQYRRNGARSTPATAVCFDPEGNRLWAGDGIGAIDETDVATGEILREFRGHSDEIVRLQVADSGDRLFGLARDEGNENFTLKVWKLPEAKLESTKIGVSLGINGQIDLQRGLVVRSPSPGKIEIVDVYGEKAPIALSIPESPATTCALGRDADLLAIGFETGHVRVWRLSTGKMLNELKAHVGAVTALAFGPGDTRLATGGEDKHVLVWRIGK